MPRIPKPTHYDPPPPEPTETEIQKAIVTVLRLLGFVATRQQVKGRRGSRSVATGRKGQPDVQLEGYGWLEVKRPGCNLSPDQEAWHAEAMARGERVAVVHSPTEAVEVGLMWRREKERAA